MYQPGRTASIKYDNKKNLFIIRVSQYFPSYNDGLDAKGSSATIDEATRDAIIHFHELLWKQINRRTKEVFENSDAVLNEMLYSFKKDQTRFTFLSSDIAKKRIFKQTSIL
jgi:hypothetical protein